MRKFSGQIRKNCFHQKTQKKILGNMCKNILCCEGNLAEVRKWGKEKKKGKGKSKS